MPPLLQVKDLRTYFYTESGVAKAVDGVDLDIMQGEVLGLVGESGSGKSVTALSILRLIPDPPGRIVDGRIDGVIFFRDPLTSHPHEPDIQAVLKVCDVHDVPLATNRASALLLIRSLHDELTR